jgi:hypothetical protein
MQKYIASAEREQCIFTKFQQARALDCWNFVGGASAQRESLYERL